MSDQKMDFIQWQSANREDLDEETRTTEKNFIGGLRALTFNIDKKGTNIVSQINGQIVFVDRYSPYEVAIGDTWICQVKPEYTVSYAMPILKITLSEVVNYNEELRENVLSALWKRNRKEITEMLEGRLKSEIQAKLVEDVNKTNADEIARLKSEIDRLTIELHETRFQLDTQSTVKTGSDEDYILLGSDDVVKASLPQTSVMEGSEPAKAMDAGDLPHVSAQSVSPAVQASQIPKAVPQIKRVTAIPQKFEVERIGEDSLRSPSFTDHRYFAHMSPDYHTLVIRPNDDGKVYCMRNIIRLEGLGRVSPFTAKKFLPAEYSEAYGGMIVRL